MSLNLNTELFLANTTNNSGTINLPAASSIPGRVINFKDSNTTFGTNGLTLVCNGSDTFEDGSSTKILKEKGGIIQIVASGTKWYVLTGTQLNSVNVSTFVANSISTNIISTASLITSSIFTSSIYSESTLTLFNSNVFAGTRVWPNQNVNKYVSTQVFLPNSLSNLTWWFDASFSTSITISSFSNTNLCTNWASRGGTTGVNYTISTGVTYDTAPIFSSILSTNTINNLPGIVFNSAKFNYLSNKGYTIPVNSLVTNGLDSEFTTFITFIKQQNTNGNMSCIQNSGNNFTAIYTSLVNYGQAFSPGNPALSITTPSNLPSIITFTRQGGNSIVRINGSNTVNSNFNDFLAISPVNTNAINYIVGFDTIGNYYNGSLHEIIHYRATLPISDIQRVEGYLAWKWGFQSNLINTHSFRFLPPY